MNEQLLKPVTVEEVGNALNQMGPLKAPGLDGFYQKNWASIGEEVCNAVTRFFMSDQMDGEVNSIFNVLVPKKQNPTTVVEFRPISLCNVIYKITSKVFANSLKLVLPHIISQNQSAFLPGRLITQHPSSL